MKTKEPIKKYSYQIGGMKYSQRPLVLGQVAQLLDVLKDISILSVDPLGVMVALKEKLPDALAVVLNPDGIEIKDKDLGGIAERLRFSLEVETALGVVDDFFLCNRLSLVLKRAKEIAGRIEIPSVGDGSKDFASSSPEGTSPSETPSSGDSLQPSASPT